MAIFHKDGAYWIDYYDQDGQRRREKVGPSKAQAARRLRARREAVLTSACLYLVVSREPLAPVRGVCHAITYAQYRQLLDTCPWLLRQTATVSKRGQSRPR